MNDLIQVIKILDDKQLKEVNSGIDDLEFIPSSVGFHDGDTVEPRVDNNIRTRSNEMETAIDNASDVDALAALYEYVNTGTEENPVMERPLGEFPTLEI